MIRLLFSLAIVIASKSSFSQQAFLEGDTLNRSFFHGPLDYMIFGVYCGECGGHCATMYKIDNTGLAIDETDGFFKNNGKITFADKGWKDDRFDTAKILLESIPTQLVTSKMEQFGCPDCTDGCGIYVELKMNAVVKKFYIDTNQSQLPEFLKPFARAVYRVAEKFWPK
jgi:hypothetical protein